jgi:hypothetical protein
LEDVIRGTAVLEFVCRRMFGKVYSCLVGIANECGIEDGLKVSRGHGRRRHENGEGWAYLGLRGLLVTSTAIVHTMSAQLSSTSLVKPYHVFPLTPIWTNI